MFSMKESRTSSGVHSTRPLASASIDVDVDAVGCQDAGGDLLEVLALQARVAGQGQRRVLVVGIQVVGDALGGLGDHVDVHAVGADAERAAQAGGAKGEAAVEGVVELVAVLGDEPRELLGQVSLVNVVLPRLDGGLDGLIHV